jgi:hypothetical protein
MSRFREWDPSKKRGKLYRKINFREKLPRILIVCEGEKTEPLYFKGFKITSVRLEVEPAGAVHYSVVERAKQMREIDPDYDEVWCVFDRDKHAANPRDVEKFNSAIALAKNNQISIAYSNDAFELWYLLHFIYFDTSITRADYVKKLKKILGSYVKNDPKMYFKLEDKMDVAIKNAKRLYNNSNKNDPANADPSTTVFLLVEKLKSLK